MPYINSGDTSSLDSDQSPTRAPIDAQDIVTDAEYIANAIDGYTELPLSEQLEPIAVVGMGCRLPGDVRSPGQFWKMMINQESGQTARVPSSRFNIDSHYHPDNDRPGSFSVLGGYFLEDTLQEFDPTFFNVTPIEAMWMDPQQRKLLEVVYEAFESAGVTLPQLAGSSTGVFVASFTSDFQQMAFKEPAFRHGLAATGVDPGIISNRVSHVFNLRGPSMLVNTACSSSVYAIHNACNALRNKECPAAVVGGVNLVLTVDQHMNTAKLGVLSPTSTCHTFDASADGYGRAEGVGAVYLKRLSDAIRDGDAIRGLIRSSATNNNGKVPAAGITHPSFAGQGAVIRHAYARGGHLDPRLTGYFECHGTGTAVGDPLEVNAVASAMNEDRQPEDGPLRIGAVKTNIGHSEAASGLSAVIKAILTVERGVIPPTRGVVNPNPAIDWAGWNVDVVREPVPFAGHLPVKRVSVNSFGYGGTNAHIIVEGADSLLKQPQTYRYQGKRPDHPTKSPRGAFNRNRPFLLPFSAHDKATLRRNIVAHTEVVDQYSLLDLSYTLATRRTRFTSRGFTVATYKNREKHMNASLAEFVFAEHRKAGPPTVGFVFTGQGAQWARMGAELMTYYPSFLRTIRHLDQVLEDLDDMPVWTLEDMLLEDASSSRVQEAEFSQPLCTAIQIALVGLLRDWGVQPVVTCGHSSGEIAAAFAAGHLSAAESIILAYYRGKVVRDINTNGAMLAVGLGAEQVESYLAPFQNHEVVIACHNSPSSVTLSGDADTLNTLQQELSEANVFARLIKTGGKAYHSPHMQPASERYEALVRRARLALSTSLPKGSQSTTVKMVSSVTNAILPDDARLDETYWSANLLSPVKFNQAMQTIGTSNEFRHVDLFVEIGPHSALAGPIRQIKAANNLEQWQYLPSLTRNAECAGAMLHLAGELFLRGHDAISMDRVTAMEEISPVGKISHRTGHMIVDLPPYQWDQEKRFWAESRQSREHRAVRFPRHDILGSMMPGCSPAEPTWRNVLRIRDLPWLRDHSLGGEAVFPMAGYFSMAMEAITQLNEMAASPVDIDGYTLRDVSVQTALVTPDDDTGVEVLINFRPAVQGKPKVKGVQQWWDFSVASVAEDGACKEHMAGTIGVLTRGSETPRRPAPRPVPNFPQRASGTAWNQALRRVGFDYGPTFQDMDDIRFDGKTYGVTSTTAVKNAVGMMPQESRHVLHPASVDSCLQLMIVAVYAGRTNAMPCGVIPQQVDELTIWAPTAAQLADPQANAYSWITKRGNRAFVGSNELVASDGQVVMQIRDMRCVAYEAAVPQRLDSALPPQPYGEMVWKQDIDLLSSSVGEMDAATLVELADFKHPGSRVLDIGGQTSKALLEKMPQLQLTATETTSELVELLQGHLEAYSQVQVKQLVLADSLESQSFKSGSYDIVVVGSNVTEGLDLVQLRGLVTSSGRVLLPANAALDDAALMAANLSKSTVKVDEHVLVTAVESNDEETITNGHVHDMRIIYGSQPPALLPALTASLQKQGFQVKASTIREPIENGEHVIMLADFEEAILASISETDFAGLQHTLTSASSLIWVTAGGLVAGKNPQFGMASGLLRSLTSEQASLNSVTLDFDTDTTSLDAIVDTITAKAQQQLHSPASLEPEYCVSGSETFISRLVPNRDLNSTYSADLSQTIPKAFNPQEPIVGQVQSGKVVFTEDDRVETALAPTEVEVRVLYTGLNKEDVLVITGVDYPTTFSHEIGGVVHRVGSAVQRVSVGDSVVGFSIDKYATFQRVGENMVQRLQSGETLPDLVSLPMAYGAAIYGVKTLANLKAGERLLLLNGSGLAGTAALQIARTAGATPFITVKDESGVEALQKTTGIPRENILLEDDLSWLHSLQFDVVFSSGWVDSALAREAWRFIGPLGRFIDCGRKDVLSRNVLDKLPVHRGAQYLAFDMLSLYQSKPQILADLLTEAVQLYRQGDAPSLQPLEVCNITQLSSCVSSFSDDLGAGKTVIAHEESQNTLDFLPTRPALRLQSDATYLLVGCLGGLGRSLTSWMFQKGARSFLFLSRSGTDSQQAAALTDDLKAAGADVMVVRGDVSVGADVERAVQSVPVEKPIRGVIQAAMVLRDGIFANMTYADWTTSITPKVKGTMNLHRVLDGVPLDFFVTTSSVSGTLGTPGQSNYAAGNSYLDSLARHRRQQGQPATSIILPMVLGVGVVAQNTELEVSLKRKGMYGIDETALLEAFEVAMLEQQPTGGATTTAVDHIVVGLDPSELRKAAEEAGDSVSTFWAEDARFSAVVHAMNAGGSSGGSGGAQTVLAALKENSSITLAEAMDLVADGFIGKLSRMLLLGVEEFERDGRSIASYGVDSMVGAELRNWIFKEMGIDIPFQQLLSASLSINKFAEQSSMEQMGNMVGSSQAPRDASGGALLLFHVSRGRYAPRPHIRAHNVVLACLPAGLTGTNSAAAVAIQMKNTFPAIRFGLMVGIGGGVPSKEADIRLGDVVVSQPGNGHGGVVQYDFGKLTPSGFKRTGFLNTPPTILLAAVTKLRSNLDRGRSDLSPHLSKLSNLPKFGRGQTGSDILFEAEYNHSGENNCLSCTAAGMIQRKERANNTPMIHYGTIASGNQVMRDGVERDKISLNTRTVDNALRETKRTFYLPLQRNHKFVGRSEELNTLKQKLLVSKDCQKATLSGLGGIGKTQVALQFAYSVKADCPEFSIFWVQSLSMETFELSCTEAAKVLGIRQAQENSEDVKILFRQHLSAKSAGKWLLIVDNADDLDLLRGTHQTEGLLAFLPESNDGLTLFTSRHGAVAQYLTGSDVVEIGKMTRRETRDLLKKSLIRTNPSDDSESVTNILSELEYLPLAITQAVAYINANKSSISEYLRLLKRTEQDAVALISTDFGDTTRYRNLSNAIAKTWMITFNRILKCDTLAADLLAFMSCIEWRAIPYSILPTADPEARLAGAIGTLCSYSFLEKRDDGTKLDMHRLVHLATRVWVNQNGRGIETRMEALKHLLNVFPSHDYINREIWRAYLPHVAHIGRDKRCKGTEEMSGLCLKVGQCLYVDGRIKEALLWLQESCEWRDRNFAQDNMDRLASQHVLAGAYEANGQVKKAVQLLEHVVAIRLKALAEDHPDQLASQHALAGAYKANGQVKEAVQLLEHVVAIRSKVLAEDHPDQLSSQYELAIAYEANGQVKEAVKLLEQVVAIESKVLAEDHPSRLISERALATFYKDRMASIARQASETTQSMSDNNTTFTALSDQSPTEQERKSSDTSKRRLLVRQLKGIFKAGR
ncbi:hypothetical protein FE257_000871 [Aspergillus nanangensis]|uniref:Carrier domain-containing protein n=1 Tax=Aspergillus nanangensis TaxID=2582783 RepID=A0AAD4CED9_ASPNN|nr:hypothetical protein FE257_000871 [Aspergillus nanangensis]